MIDRNTIRNNAVTLLEMLVVIALVGVLSALATPAINALGKTASVSSGATRLAGLAAVARQNALSKQTLTALLVSNEGETRGRLIAVVELTPGNAGGLPAPTDWHPITQWEALPDGTIVEQLSAQQVGPQPALPAFSHRDGEIRSFQCTVFCPDGRTLDSNSQTFRLAEGFYASDATTPTFTRPASDGTPRNYCNLTILPNTGRVKLDRP